MNLDLFLKYNNCNVTEGYSEQVSELLKILKELVKNDNKKMLWKLALMQVIPLKYF